MCNDLKRLYQGGIPGIPTYPTLFWAVHWPLRARKHWTWGSTTSEERWRQSSNSAPSKLPSRVITWLGNPSEMEVLLGKSLRN